LELVLPVVEMSGRSDSVKIASAEMPPVLIRAKIMH
jgi:hypothetical protein